jgi:predicted DNA-binding protein YlxM (UPF0122 family)
MELHGIITGDIIESRKIDPPLRAKLFDDINIFLKGLKKSWITSYETYRGDSLQCLVKSPENVLRIALMIRSWFRGYSRDGQQETRTKKTKQQSTRGYFATEFDIRLAVGIGKADFIKKEKITSSDGEAFRFSGEALDELMSTSQRLAVKTLHPEFNEQTVPAILLLDALIQKWTQNQAEVVLYKLQDKKEDEIAALLGISQSAVNQRTKTAQWYPVEKLLEQFEKTVKKWTV